MLPFLSDKIFMVGINKWKPKEHFEVLISHTKNKTKKPPKSKKEKTPSSLQPAPGGFLAFLPLEDVSHHVTIVKQSSFVPVSPYCSIRR